MQRLIPVAATLLLMSAGALAQPKGGITPDMISRSLPLEGAPLAVPGPYKVTSAPAFGSPGHVVFYPETLDAFPKKDSLPVMVWGNGGCARQHTLRRLPEHRRFARFRGGQHGRSTGSAAPHLHCR